jgi:hypothetical protein
MNIDKVIEVLAHIEHDPDMGFNMTVWYAEEHRGGLCRTTACFAGHAALANGWEPTTFSDMCRNSQSGEVSSYTEAGADILGLDFDEALQVFHLGDLQEVYEWIADHEGIDEQVLRDKVDAYEVIE